jgi:monoamine oxidase
VPRSSCGLRELLQEEIAALKRAESPGEHTSVSGQGYMEGAVMSGLRAADASRKSFRLQS